MLASLSWPQAPAKNALLSKLGVEERREKVGERKKERKKERERFLNLPLSKMKKYETCNIWEMLLLLLLLLMAVF